MFTPTTEELLAALRRLPLEERLRVIGRAAEEAQADTLEPNEAATASGSSLLGLFADEPELADQVCAFAYAARGSARLRVPHE
ncbi:MAG TPA: hypothetical protein PLU22_15445 [Polyangiaceae bacterium]|nr:hypothetical protein [Polyangiaceae bacterium]